MNLRQEMKKLLVTFGLILFSLILQNKITGQTDSDYQELKTANKLYSEEKYESAAELYEKIISKGYSAPELNYNLGNAYYRMGNYKSAILNYERALLLNSDDEDIKTNLEFAQKFVQDKIEVVPTFFLIRWVQAIINLFNVNTWSVISVLSFVFFLILIITFLFTKKVIFRKLSVYLGFLLLVVSLISFYCAYKQDIKLNSHNTAIIFSPAVTVKSSPNENGTDLFIIHEGLKVYITGKSTDWFEIRLSDGKIGWLPKESLVEI